VNPRQGIETYLLLTFYDQRVWVSRKTVNPRQGIETYERQARMKMLPLVIRRKTVNPRQGIETPPTSMFVRMDQPKVGRQ